MCFYLLRCLFSASRFTSPSHVWCQGNYFSNMCKLSITQCTFSIRIVFTFVTSKSEAAFTLGQSIWNRSFISTVRPTVHTNPSRKRSFSKTFFKLEELCVVWTENIWSNLKVETPFSILQANAIYISGPGCSKPGKSLVHSSDTTTLRRI